MAVPAINVSHSLGRISAQLGLLQKERMAAAVRAINRTMVSVRAEGARAMAREYPGIKIAGLKKQIRIKRASRSDPRAHVSFSGKRFRLYTNFGMRRRGLWGVSFGRLPWRVETGSGQVVDAAMLQRAFLQRSREHGTPNVWTRLGKERIPFEVLVAPALAQAFVEKGIGEALVKLARTRFDTVFLQEAKFRLSKR